MRVGARRTLAASAETVWTTVGDTARIARWWPLVTRVESASDHGFTEVLTSKRGKEVRADFRVTAHQRARRLAWALDLEGSPFARIFSVSEYELTLQASEDGAATEVRLQHHVAMAGTNRLGAFLAYRSARRTLRQALAALESEVRGA